MELKNFAVQYILEWFQIYRSELDMREDEAINFYEQIKDQLVLAESNNDREAIALILRTFLETYYSDPTNQVCFEVVEEPEYWFVTSELKAIGFLYYEELDGLIKMVKKQDWYNDFANDESLLQNEEFKQKVRELLDTYWHSLIGF